ncbi:hypothetical protein Ddye_008853 [Dipteronia dyeriana]|uniref:Uncharacterized protein n=1 Tax=Dipteronia dyeriana TaxID=168575 RepID=A0AAD9XA87_9ROSI|nr:hypothetical protein Ddye_008853 [Dipteronia dyeriana]
MSSCTKLAHHDLKQMLLNKGSQGDMVVTNRRDPQVVRDIIFAAIVSHDLPFKFVEWSWIRRLIEYLCDDVTLSRNTAKVDVLSFDLDLRYKMTFVEFAYKKVYDIDSPELDIVRSKLLSLFNEYTFTSMSTKGSSSTSLPSSSRCVSESFEVDEVAEDILKLTLENSLGPSIESATSQFSN